MVVSKNKLLIEMVNNQNQDIDSNKKLEIKDIHRICRNLTHSIFDESKCSIWQGYITKIQSTGTQYVNFFYKTKKCALHRLLYINYIGELNKNEYLRFKCSNKGICCNLSHIEKIQRKGLSKKTLDLNNGKKENENDTKIEIVESKTKDNKNKLMIIF